MNGAESLVKTLLSGGLNVCFANPGTSQESGFAPAFQGRQNIYGLHTGLEDFRSGRLFR